MRNNTIEIQIPEDYHLERIDKFLVNNLETGLSRSYIQKLIRNKNIRVNGSDIKQNYRVKSDDTVLIDIPEPEELSLTPRDIPIDIIFQDESIAVINKPPGLVVHPGPGNWDNTLVNALLYRLENLSSIGGVIRPGIVHRLDKDTSGLMVIAKSDRAHQRLTEDFSGRIIKKIYACIVADKPGSPEGTIDKPIGRHPKYRHKMTVLENGRDALTEYKIEKIWNTATGIFTLLAVRLHTGRTHQIRVHLSSMGNPVVGDPIYSKKWAKYNVPHLLLAAVRLEFRHPVTGDNMDFQIPLPEHISDYILKLDKIAIKT